MLNILIFSIALFLLAPNCEDYLNEVQGFNNTSYYKDEVYTEQNWKSFLQLKEPNEVISKSNPDLHLLNAALFFATNQLRAKHKKPDFKFSASLRDAAVIHTNEMVQRNFFSHTNGKNRKWDKPDVRVRNCGNMPKAIGENIDLLYLEEGDTYISFAKRVVKHLYDSAPHRKNMLGNFTHLGASTMMEGKDKKGYRYLKSTQSFGTY